MSGLCHQHGGVWLASCEECRAARRVLVSVQSGTVHAPSRAADLRRSELAALEAAGVAFRRPA